MTFNDRLMLVQFLYSRQRMAAERKEGKVKCEGKRKERGGRKIRHHYSAS